MSTNPAPDWAAIRHRYEETQDPVADICRDAGIDQRALASTRKREKWRRKYPRPFPAGRKPAAPSEAADTAHALPPTLTSRAVSPIDAATNSEVAADPRETPAASPLPRRLPSTPAARRRLLDRLVSAISLKLEQLERQMTQSLDADGAGPTTATDHERETRAIGALIDNLEKITEMETGLSTRSTKRGSAAANVAATDLADEAERCRRELADRLSKLVDAAARSA